MCRAERIMRSARHRFREERQRPAVSVRCLSCVFFVVFGEAIETGCGGIHSQYTESRYLQGMRRGGFSVL